MIAARLSGIERAVVVAVGAATLLLVPDSLRSGIAHDAALMHYIAQRIIAGAVPYRDIFDVNMPVIYWIHVGVITILGPGDLAWCVFDLSAMAGIALCIYLAFPPSAKAFAVVAAATAWLYHLTDGGANSLGQRDFLVALPLAAFAAAYCRLIGGDRARAPLVMFLLGVLLGVATFMKPVAAALFVVFAAHDLIVRRLSRRTARDLLCFAAGGGAAATAILLHLWAIGALASFIDVQVNFVAATYARVRLPFEIRAAAAAIFAAAMLSVSAAAHGMGKRILASPIFVFFLLTLYGAFHVVAQGKYWVYHYHVMGLFGLFATAAAYAELRASAGRAIRLIGALASATAVGAVAFDSGYAIRDVVANVAWSRPPVTDRLIVDLDGLGRAGRIVQPLDATNGIIHALYLTNRPLPTRFMYGFPFLLDGSSPYLDGLRAEFLAALRAAGYPPLVIAARQWPLESIDDPVPRWPGLAAVIASTYRLAVERDDPSLFHGYRIYVRRDQPDRP